ncbi:MAG TPA: hypothetical protein PLV45_09420 [bacterium]|nr:hypothetical protein [bacterium]
MTIETRLRSIIIFLTFRCRVGCATCNVSARPDAPEGLSPDWITQFIQQLSPAIHPRYIIWTGGEPFMAFNTLATGIRMAGDRGFESEVLTGGDWFARAPEYLEQLSESGPFRLRISLDAEHQRTVTMDTIHLLIDTALEKRIPIGFTLRDIPGIEPSPRTLRETVLQRHPMLENLSMGSSRLFHVIPTIPPSPAGPAADGIANTKSVGSITDPGPCRLGFRDLVIGPDGRVYPCCGLFGLGIDDHIHAGSALTDLPASPDILRNANPLFPSLLHGGAVILAKKHGWKPETDLGTGYVSPCHACRSMLPFLIN